ncbi:hypothetical protein [Gracilibacillus salinarum]|uniref:DUF7847 domain-containing protein n=1 Tax=Gracilibacillus salinarum TaxID=2932255 RepID=A0ABY4GJM9_9BACI|nr:hypothetical protein [Gracilibacillus salinarum]UOQ84200.1 hypothetical protein MUN87_16005 [Gracilibacillus salinarum]
MNGNVQKPLRFAEILDQTFRIIKQNIKPIFLISFFIMVPIFVIQAIVLILTGRELFISVDPSQSIFSSLMGNIESIANTSYEENVISNVVSMISLLAVPLIAGALILAVKQVRNGEEIVVKDMIKGALPRYFPILFSTLLISIIAIAIILPGFIITAIIGGSSSIIFHPVAGVMILLLLMAGFFLAVGLLFTRWSLFLPAVLFEKVAPGLSRSWHLTKKQTWKFFGLLLVLIIISLIITSVLQIPLIFLGNSVLYYVLTNIFSLISWIITYVGYSVMYFDASIRQEGSDLQSLINEYQGT